MGPSTAIVQRARRSEESSARGFAHEIGAHAFAATSVDVAEVVHLDQAELLVHVMGAWVSLSPRAPRRKRVGLRALPNRRRSKKRLRSSRTTLGCGDDRSPGSSVKRRFMWKGSRNQANRRYSHLLG